MGKTRDVLKELGSSTVSEQVLVEAGQKVLRDGVKEYLASKGLTEAVGFVITLKNGETFTILSEENPKMSTPMGEVKNIEVKQSAKAGLNGVAGVLGDMSSITIMFELV